MVLFVLRDDAMNKLRRIHEIYRGSYLSAHVLLNLLNELRKIDKMRSLLSIFISSSQRAIWCPTRCTAANKNYPEREC